MGILKWRERVIRSKLITGPQKGLIRMIRGMYYIAYRIQIKPPSIAQYEQ